MGLAEDLQEICAPWFSSWRPTGTPGDTSGDAGHLHLGDKATFTV